MPGWNERVFTFYDAEGAEALRGALERFDGGRLVVNVVDMPIKCPVAPLEFAFLADWYLRERGVRDARRAGLRDAARRRLHQAGRLRAARRPAGGEGDRARHRVQRRRGRRRRRQAHLLRRARPRLRPARHRPSARRRRLCRALARSRRRARVRPHRQATLQTQARSRTCSRSATRPTSRPRRPGSVTHFEAEVLDREHRPLPRRRGARRRLRRARQLLHRDRLPQGAADRLQLRDRAAARPLPRPRSGCRCCASRGSTTWASCSSSGSTGTRCCPAGTSPASARRCRPPASSATLSTH